MKRKRKQICIIGLGQFGSELARNLVPECEVLAIDIEEDLVNAMSEDVHRAMCMDARDLASLQTIVTPDFDEAIVSMSESIETSVLCTLHLKQIGVKRIWAKALNEDHATILKAIGATDVIFPERETARRLGAKIQNPNLLDFIPLMGGYRAVEMVGPESYAGQSLADLHLRKKYGVFIMAVKQSATHPLIFLPGPNYIVEKGDVMILIGPEKSLDEIEEMP
ncbi:MAG: TrkA family potassium uptake protein [Acidobacteriota bacterium]|jgi:trk system potassium uptake protein